MRLRARSVDGHRRRHQQQHQQQRHNGQWVATAGDGHYECDRKLSVVVLKGLLTTARSRLGRKKTATGPAARAGEDDRRSGAGSSWGPREGTRA